MAKISEKYEAMVVFSVSAGEDNVKGLVEKFKTLIENNGTVEEVNEWGKRKLAYEIAVSYTHLTLPTIRLV